MRRRLIYMSINRGAIKLLWVFVEGQIELQILRRSVLLD